MNAQASTTVPGALDSLKPIRAFVMKYANEAAIDNKATYRLITAVDEIATNIVNYGYQEAGRSGNIAVHAQITDEQLIITLEDRAIPFDPLAHDLPDDEEISSDLTLRDIGGLGIFLTLNGVDEFKYEFVDEKNRNIFIMNRPNGDMKTDL
jgi:serine/threonine-protein kinase RsbW